MGEAEPLLQLRQASRVRAGREVVRDLNLTLERGQVLGLLGVNGAGKSTTLAMLAGALRPSRGSILLAGHDFVEQPELARRLSGWLPERTPLWPELTVTEHLRAHGRLRGLRGRALQRALRRVCERLQLEPVCRRLARALSQGQRQRLGLACALVHQPALLILDEPGNGLDPLQAGELRTLIREHADAGGAVVLSTHVLPEVTAVCDRAAILHEGRLRHDGPLEEASGTCELVLTEDVDATRLQSLPPVADVHMHQARHFRVTLADGSDIADLLRALLAQDLAPRSVTPGQGALERLFLDIATSHAPFDAEAA